MAYAVKYLFAWKSANGTDHKIQVLVDGYSGSVIQRRLGRGPILKKQKSGTVCGTSLEFYPECIVDGEFAEFYTSDPKAYKVELYAASTLLWVGYVTPELYSEPDIPPPYDVQVIATDGIGELKLYDYVAQGTVTLRALLGYLLAYTGLSTDVNLISSLKPGSGGAGSLLSKSINLDFMAGKSCYEVLTYILDTLHATITWYRGAWLVTRETNVTMTSGKVRYFNTSGNSALFSGSSVQVGGAYSSNMWPVGHLTQAIDPAKKSVTVQAPWHTVRGLANPDMDRDASWVKNSGATFESTPGCYSLPYLGASSPGYACIKQDLQMAGLRVPMSFTLKGTGLGRIEVGDPRTPYWTNGAVYAVIVYTVGTTTYILRQGEEGFEWKEGPLPNFDLFYFSSGGGDGIPSKSFDTALADRISAEELTIDSIPTFDQSGSFPAGTLTIYIAGLNCYLYGAEINVILPKGYKDRLHLDNGARGEGEEVEVAIGRETSAIDYYKAFLQGILLDSGALITSFSDANFTSSLDFLSFISRDYALSKALPRLKQTGKVFIESAVEFIPLLLTKGALDYWLETYAWDMYEDEVEVEALSLPGGTITVQSETVSEAGGTTGGSSGSSGGGSSSMDGGSASSYFEIDEDVESAVALKAAYIALSAPDFLIGTDRESVVGDLEIIGSALQSLQAQIDSAATRSNFDELTATSVAADIVAASRVYAERYYLTDDIYFYIDVVNGIPCVHLNADFITDGDQILGDGTPGGGGGGGVTYFSELQDVSNAIAGMSSSQLANKMLIWDTGATPVGGESATGAWSVIDKSSVGITTDATHAAHGLMSAADKTKLDSIDTTDIAHGETAYQALDVIGPALQSLQAQIDSVATKTNFDELTATAVAADIVAASDIYGALHGNADTASDADKLDGHDSSYFGTASAVSTLQGYFTNGVANNADKLDGNDSSYFATASAVSTLQGYFTNGVANNADKLDGIHAVDLFTAMTSGAATNLSITIGGTTKTATLYATYDSASENIADKFGIVSSALQALQGQIDAVASRSDISDYEATTEAKMDYICDLMRSLQAQADSIATRVQDMSANGYFDMLSVGGDIYCDYLYSTGDQTLSDERHKKITREIVLTADEIASCRAVAFDWIDRPGGSFGTIAQDWEKILPESVDQRGDTLYLAYKSSTMVGLINLAREVVRLRKEVEQLRRN